MPSDEVLPEDYAEWKAETLRNLGQAYRAYEQGLADDYGAAEAHRVATQAKWDHVRVLDDDVRGRGDGVMYELG
jgi:hypothetical protein